MAAAPTGYVVCVQAECPKRCNQLSRMARLLLAANATTCKCLSVAAQCGLAGRISKK